MRVHCDVEDILLENDRGFEVDSICATCRRCGHAVEVFGTSEDSVRRGLVTLREECPKNESNWYCTEDDRERQEPSDDEYDRGSLTADDDGEEEDDDEKLNWLPLWNPDLEYGE